MAGDLENRSPVLFDIIRGIVEEWPQPPDPIRGRSLADALQETRVQPIRQPSKRGVLRSLIRKVAVEGAGGLIRRPHFDAHPVTTPLPSLDRRSAVLRALGFEPLLHTARLPWRLTVPAGERVHVYLDVSGSVHAIRGALYGAVLDCEPLVHPVVHLFSTQVAEVSLAELRRGVCKSTGGTDIACVARHMSDNRVRRALVVTDGWVGAPRGEHRATLAAARIAVALIGPRANPHDLADSANYITTINLGG